jgi:DNA (cytosine-5)-methyltransferase 1
VDLNLMTNPCAWFLKDLAEVPSNGVKVMTTFSCGGGSSMGYRRAGCDVIAANDIDPEMEYHYKYNLNPKLYYLCPIKDLITMDLPDQLFNLDILDGSPPCSTFSMNGNREKDWGKDKMFREGQSKQVLSDLFFDWIDLVARLKPKVAIAENVKGMILGNAKGYTKMIIARLREVGYRPQLFLVNAADCGVPQKRERVFFCAIRNDLDRPPLVLAPKCKWITAGEATDDLQALTEAEKINTKAGGFNQVLWYKTKRGKGYDNEKNKVVTGKKCGFSHRKLDDRTSSCTLPGKWNNIKHWGECRYLTFREYKRLGSFPDDYHARTDKIGKYMVGMSVPPKMAETVARAVCEQWLNTAAGQRRPSRSNSPEAADD